jgi:hypothetical protein
MDMGEPLKDLAARIGYSIVAVFVLLLAFGLLMGVFQL